MESAIYTAIKTALAAGRPVAIATIVGGGHAGRQVVLDAAGRTLAGGLGSAGLDAAVRDRALVLLPAFRSEKVTIADGSADVFIECHGPPPALVIVGAVHVAIPLVQFARILGFRTVVVDPRSAFATRERFPDADELLAEWPAEAFERVRLDEATSVVVLSHDLKIDVPALALALRSPARYVGALGSRKTQRKRAQALEAEGLRPDDVSRVHSPIGLALGGRRAEEIALAIMAEVVAVAHGQATARAIAPPDE